MGEKIMYKSERESEILEIMESNGYVTVEYLAQKLHVSPSSVRRDLAVLEQKGMLRRSYGGAEISDSTNRNTPFSLRSHENAVSKKRIARAAVKLVKEGDVVFVDGSSTAFFLFEELVSVKGITILTNSIDGLFFLSSYGVRALSTGGMVSPENRAVLVGEQVKNAFAAVRADIAFFSVASLGKTGDLFDCYMDEVPLRRVMLQYARKKVLLLDGTKVGFEAAYFQGTLSDVDSVICDRPIESDYAEHFPKVKFHII